MRTEKQNRQAHNLAAGTKRAECGGVANYLPVFAHYTTEQCGMSNIGAGRGCSVGDVSQQIAWLAVKELTELFQCAEIKPHVFGGNEAAHSGFSQASLLS